MTLMTERNKEIVRRLQEGQKPKLIAEEVGAPLTTVYNQSFNLRKRMKKQSEKTENFLRKTIREQREEIERLKGIITEREMEFIDLRDRLKKAGENIIQRNRAVRERDDAIGKYKELLDEVARNQRVMRGAAQDLDALQRFCNKQQDEIDELKKRLNKPSIWSRIMPRSA